MAAWTQKRLRVADLRGRVVIALQKNVLFPGSIADNTRHAGGVRCGIAVERVEGIR